MSFNFGAQPFKHQPKPGYIAVCEAPKNHVSISEASLNRTEGKQPSKVNNAPQAIIIEVIINVYYFYF